MYVLLDKEISRIRSTRSGPEIKNDYAGEDRKEFTLLNK
jgi:hypothetical protein